MAMENYLSVKNIFNPGNPIELDCSEATGYLKKVQATVLSVRGEDIMIRISEPDLMNKISPKDEITVCYHSADGKIFTFGSYQVRQIIEDYPIMLELRPFRVDFSTLRRSTRVTVNLPFYYLLDNEVCTGELVDLSVCGLFAMVEPDARLLEGMPIAFHLMLPNSVVPIPLKGEIVRNEIGDDKLGIGVNFTNITEAIRSEIIKYILH